jgi:N utilization substance protein A
MENLALIDSFSELKDDKLIDRVTLTNFRRCAFRNALKKNTVQMIILTSL